MTAPELLRISDAHLPSSLRVERYARMRANVLGFYRGSAGVFFSRVGREPLLHQGPVGWLCGDLHAANFGTYKADNGLVYFDLNDFDEACLGPVLFDVLRLLVSVLLLAEYGGQAPAEQRRCAQELLSQYTAALATGKAGYLERDTARGLIKQLLRQVAARLIRAQLKERTRHHFTRLRPGPSAPPLPKAECGALLVQLEAWCRAQPIRPFGRILDASQRVAGVGSLGTPRYLVLAEHHQSGKRPMLLDLKAARPSALAPFISLPQPAWASQAHQVVEVQRRLQAVAPALLTAVPLLDHSFVLRVLQPSADKFAFTPHPTHRLLATLSVLARLTAWAQLRSTGRQGSASADDLMTFAQASAWQEGVLDLAQLRNIRYGPITGPFVPRAYELVPIILASPFAFSQFRGRLRRFINLNPKRLKTCCYAVIGWFCSFGRFMTTCTLDLYRDYLLSSTERLPLRLCQYRQS